MDTQNTCYDEIELCAQNTSIIISSIINTNWEGPIAKVVELKVPTIGAMHLIENSFYSNLTRAKDLCTWKACKIKVLQLRMTKKNSDMGPSQHDFYCSRINS